MNPLIRVTASASRFVESEGTPNEAVLLESGVAPPGVRDSPPSEVVQFGVPPTPSSSVPEGVLRLPGNH